MLRDQVAEPLDDRGREVAAHLVVEERIVRERGAADRVLEAALCVGEQDTELGPCHRPARPGTLGHLLRRREGLDLAFQLPVRLETLHEILVCLDALGRDHHLLREDLCLEVVVVEDVRGHVLLHRVEELVALLLREIPGGDGDPEQDLQVDLVVGEIDAGGVVDEVGVDAPTGIRVLDATALCQPEIAPLGDDPRPEVRAVDPDRVVRAVADLGVALVRPLHEGADAAVPQEVDRSPEDRREHLVRRRGVHAHARALPSPPATAGSTSPGATRRRRPGEIFERS